MVNLWVPLLSILAEIAKWRDIGTLLDGINHLMLKFVAIFIKSLLGVWTLPQCLLHLHNRISKRQRLHLVRDRENLRPCPQNPTAAARPRCLRA